MLNLYCCSFYWFSLKKSGGKRIGYIWAIAFVLSYTGFVLRRQNFDDPLLRCVPYLGFNTAAFVVAGIALLITDEIFYIVFLLCAVIGFALFVRALILNKIHKKQISQS